MRECAECVNRTLWRTCFWVCVAVFRVVLVVNDGIMECTGGNQSVQVFRGLILARFDDATTNKNDILQIAPKQLIYNITYVPTCIPIADITVPAICHYA